MATDALTVLKQHTEAYIYVFLKGTVEDDSLNVKFKSLMGNSLIPFSEKIKHDITMILDKFSAVGAEPDFVSDFTYSFVCVIDQSNIEPICQLSADGPVSLTTMRMCSEIASYVFNVFAMYGITTTGKEELNDGGV